MSTRDPRTAPRPGDWLACDRVLIRVDHLMLGDVICACFRLDGAQPYAITAVPLLEFAQACRTAGVVPMPDDDPRQFATILEAP